MSAGKGGRERRMTTRVVAIASELGNVSAGLKEKGYQVVPLAGTDLTQVDAVVVSGVSNNLMGVADTSTKAPVIEARGLSTDEIADQIARRTGELG